MSFALERVGRGLEDDCEKRFVVCGRCPNPECARLLFALTESAERPPECLVPYEALWRWRARRRFRRWVPGICGIAISVVLDAFAGGAAIWGVTNTKDGVALALLLVGPTMILVAVFTLVILTIQWSLAERGRPANPPQDSLRLVPIRLGYRD